MIEIALDSIAILIDHEGIDCRRCQRSGDIGACRMVGSRHADGLAWGYGGKEVDVTEI